MPKTVSDKLQAANSVGGGGRDKKWVEELLIQLAGTLLTIPAVLLLQGEPVLE